MTQTWTLVTYGVPAEPSSQPPQAVEAEVVEEVVALVLEAGVLVDEVVPHVPQVVPSGVLVVVVVVVVVEEVVVDHPAQVSA